MPMTLTSLPCVVHMPYICWEVKSENTFCHLIPKSTNLQEKTTTKREVSWLSILDPSRPTLLSLFSVLAADQLLFLRRSLDFCFFPGGGCRIIQHVVLNCSCLYTILYLIPHLFSCSSAAENLQWNVFFCNFRNFGWTCRTAPVGRWRRSPMLLLDLMGGWSGITILSKSEQRVNDVGSQMSEKWN